MQATDSETRVRIRRVQELRRQLGQLVALSMEQRRSIERLLGELEELARRAASRPLVKAAGASSRSTSPSSSSGPGDR